MDDRSQMVGMKLSSYTYTVERGKMKELVMAIGDSNSVYLDREAARAEGYRDVIASPTFGTVIDHWGGMDFMDLCSLLKVNPVMVLHGEQDYRYYGEINPGDEITVNTVFSGYLEKKNMYIFTLDSDYVNQKGERVLQCRKTIIERKGV